MELHYSSRNSHQKNLDLEVAEAACCGELWHGVSIKILCQFRAQRCFPHHKTFTKSVLCAVLLLGSLAHLVLVEEHVCMWRGPVLLVASAG